MDIGGAIIRMGPVELLLALFITGAMVLLAFIPVMLFGLRRRVDRLHAEMVRLREALRAIERPDGEAPAPPVERRADPVAATLRAVRGEETLAHNRRPLVARRD